MERKNASSNMCQPHKNSQNTKRRGATESNFLPRNAIRLQVYLLVSALISIRVDAFSFGRRYGAKMLSRRPTCGTASFRMNDRIRSSCSDRFAMLLRSQAADDIGIECDLSTSDNKTALFDNENSTSDETEVPTIAEDAKPSKIAAGADGKLVLDDVLEALNMSMAAVDDAPSELSPPLTFDKYLTMQGKRVPVSIQYSRNMRPFFLTVAKKIKEKYPDVIVKRQIFVDAVDEAGSTFSVLVDGKPVLGDAGGKRGSGRGGGSDGANHIYVSLEAIDQAITRARRKRRPDTTVYNQNEQNDADAIRAIRLEVLKAKQGSAEENEAL